MAERVLEPVRNFADDDLGFDDEEPYAPWYLGNQNKYFPYPATSGDATFPALVYKRGVGAIDSTRAQPWSDCPQVLHVAADLIGETFRSPELNRPQRFFETIRQNINDDCVEVVAEGYAAPAQETIKSCLEIASMLSRIVVTTPNLKYAAFVEESGGISLVLRSDVPRRRVSFRISPDDLRISVVSVASTGQVTTKLVAPSDVQELRGWVEWLEKRD